MGAGWFDRQVCARACRSFASACRKVGPRGDSVSRVEALAILSSEPAVPLPSRQLFRAPCSGGSSFVIQGQIGPNRLSSLVLNPPRQPERRVGTRADRPTAAVSVRSPHASPRRPRLCPRRAPSRNSPNCAPVSSCLEPLTTCPPRAAVSVAFSYWEARHPQGALRRIRCGAANRSKRLRARRRGDIRAPRRVALGTLRRSCWFRFLERTLTRSPNLQHQPRRPGRPAEQTGHKRGPKSGHPPAACLSTRCTCGELARQQTSAGRARRSMPSFSMPVPA